MSIPQSNERFSFSTASTELSTAAPTRTVVETATKTVIETTTATITTTTTPRGGDTGLSSSGITGIAVASAVAAVALALCAILVFFYLKRPRRDPPPHTCPDPPRAPSPIELGPANGFIGLPNRQLLHGASYSDITRQLGALGLLIKAHVRGSYHHDNILATPDTLHTSLRKLQLTEATCSMVTRLSIDPGTREVALRHLLAVVIFSNLDTHTVGELSLLPPSLKELSRSRAWAPKQEQDDKRIAFLMHENPETWTPLRPPPSVQSQIEALTTVLQEFLVHFVHTDDSHSINEYGPTKDQKEALACVFRASVKYGYEVFSHPTDWEFTYAQEEQGIVVVPGLKERSSPGGVLLDPPDTILAPEVVAVEPTEN
ncbi:hypothetical protein F53441_6792 [Fusarium austroafricanum]|uniref:Uncharacterized protein n=1 Tax=Fusarium austroafricanum TaxID=2364996 RepID=A0A8H4KHW9_9HYPO|nr:hypothetical protein F53441_6792 [Fusarium austroafricanum]